MALLAADSPGPAGRHLAAPAADSPSAELGPAVDSRPAVGDSLGLAVGDNVGEWSGSWDK